MPLHTLNFFSEIIFIAGFVAQHFHFMMHMKPCNCCLYFVFNTATIAEISFSKQNSSWVTSLSLAIWWCQTYIMINHADGIVCLVQFIQEYVLHNNQLEFGLWNGCSPSTRGYKYPPPHSAYSHIAAHKHI